MNVDDSITDDKILLAETVIVNSRLKYFHAVIKAWSSGISNIINAMRNRIEVTHYL